jgi:GTP pyrophosphokinase
VHRSDCPNARDLKRRPERIIEVHWADSAPSGNVTFNVEIIIEALDRLNLLLDVAQVFSENGANVLSVSSTTHRDSMVEMRFLFQVANTSSIQRILSKLQSVEGVFEARRMMPNAAAELK